MKNKLLSNVLLCFLASTMAFIFVPLYMIGNSPDDFRFIDTTTFFKSGVTFSIIFGTVLSSISVAFHLARLEKIATLFASSNLFWIVVAGLFLPISVSTGMVDPEANPVNKFNLVLLTITVTVFSLIILTAHKKYIQVFIAIVILTSITPTVISIHEVGIFESKSTNHPSLSLSNKKNILVISFDGMPGSIVSDIIKTNSYFSEELKDFVVFDNVASHALSTRASLMGELYGIQDYKSKGKTVSEITETLLDEGFDDNLITKHVPDSYQYGYRNGIKPIEISSHEMKAQREMETLEFFKYPIVRIWTSVGLNFFDWENSIAKIQPYLIGSDETLSIKDKVKNHKGGKWKKKMLLTLNIFDLFTSNLSVEDKDFSIRYMHLTFTHHPVDFDENCNYKGDNFSWYKTHQNEKGIRGQDVCAIGRFVGFIRKLKQLGIYNQSLIIFKSDHGKLVRYFSKYPDNLQINGNRKYGYNRFRPTLAIKDFEVNSQRITFRTELVLLNDIAKTLCNASGLNIGCENISGLDLLGKPLKNDEPYYIYVPRNLHSGFRYKGHISVKIPSRKESLLQAMENSPLITLSEHDVTELPNFKTHLSDIDKIASVLSKYYDINRVYPVSSGWDGFCSKVGASTPKYIRGLVPDHIEQLPVDPRRIKDCRGGYLYKSNGTDYKFIVSDVSPYEMKQLIKSHKELVDPKKWGRYGIWTDGARMW